MAPRTGLLAATAILAVAALLFARHADRDRELGERVAMAQANATVVTQMYRTTRDTAERLRQASQRQEGQVRRLGAALDASLAHAGTETAAVRLVADTAGLDTLRSLLRRQADLTDSVIVAAAGYRDAVDSLLVVVRRERAGTQAALALADSALGAEAAVSASLRAASRCRVGPFPCPTRRTVAVAGFLVGFVAGSHR